MRTYGVAEGYIAATPRLVDAWDSELRDLTKTMFLKKLNQYKGRRYEKSDILSGLHEAFTIARNDYDPNRTGKNGKVASFQTHLKNYFDYYCHEHFSGLSNLNATKKFLTFNYKKKLVGITKDFPDSKDIEKFEILIDRLIKDDKCPTNNRDLVKSHLQAIIAEQSHHISIFSETIGKEYVYDRLRSDTPTAEEMLAERDMFLRRHELLINAINSLGPRRREIFIQRKLNMRDNLKTGSQAPAMTLEDFSKKFGISKEAVRQLEERAFKHVQQYMLNEENKLNTAGQTVPA